MTQYGFHFDGKRCTGCKTCVLACKDNKDLSAEISFRKVYEYGGGTWSQSDGLWSNDAFGYYVSVACNHCDSPACMAKCPQGAISKDPDTGIVNNDPEKCIGCGTCAIACPYSAPKVDEEIKKAVRCDMCADRVAEGKQPICVEACPLRALDFGEISELRQKYGEMADIAPLPSADETKPNIVITEPVNAKPAGDTTGSVLNERENAENPLSSIKRVPRGLTARHPVRCRGTRGASAWPTIGGGHGGAIRFLLQRETMHGLQNVHARVQRLPQSGRLRVVSPGV